MNYKKNSWIHIVGAFLFPIMLMLIIYSVIGIWPFGEKSFLTMDMHNQYKAYFSLNGINLFWHGWNKPTGFPFRYSFLFSFVVLLFAWEGYNKAKELSAKALAAMSFGIFGIVSLIALLLYKNEIVFMSGEKYSYSIVFLAAAAVSCFIGKVDRRKWMCGGGTAFYIFLFRTVYKRNLGLELS